MNRPLLPICINRAWLALDAPLVQEVLGKKPWVPIPGASARAPGVLAWRGRAIALIDLGMLTGIGSALATAESRERTVVVQLGPSTLAIPVDSVREVEDVPEEKLRLPHATRQQFASREVELDGTVVPVLDLAAIVHAISAASAAA